MTQQEPSAESLAIEVPTGAVSAQTQGPTIVATTSPQQTVPSSSSRLQAFSALGRTLSEEDLKSEGVRRLLLDGLYQREAECERLAAFEDKFHVVDKRVAVQDEKLKTLIAVDVAYGVGVGVGAGLVAAATGFWDAPHGVGPLTMALGTALIIGGIAVKAVKR